MTDTPARHKSAPSATRRSAARLAAVQTLYSMEMTGQDAGAALTEFMERKGEDKRIADPDDDLVAFLVTGADIDRTALDQLIGDALSRDWSIDRLEAVLRAILRAGVFEIKSRPATPARVAISEYVDIAHAFYEGPESGLVNAVLDRVARSLRPDEFRAGGARP
jgi:N utilization substance protein B